MPHISVAQGPTNNPVERFRVLAEEEEGEQSRPGTGPRPSGGRFGRSGTSGTTDLQLPAPDAESPSSTGPQADPTSSSADTTDGSGQGTGSSPWSPPGSSGDSAQQREATPGQAPADELSKEESLAADEQNEDDPYEGVSGSELMSLARAAYEERRFEESAILLDRAETAGGVPAAELATARGYVARARGVGAL